MLTPASDRGRTDPSLFLSGMKRSAVADASLQQGEDGSKSSLVPAAAGATGPSLLLRPILLSFRYFHHVVPHFSAYMCCSDSLKPICK